MYFVDIWYICGVRYHQPADVDQRINVPIDTRPRQQHSNIKQYREQCHQQQPAILKIKLALEFSRNTRSFGMFVLTKFEIN